jgi:hypothetical protein
VDSADLDQFREAFRLQEERLQTASRSSRFKPPTDLATARITFEGIDGGKEILGEVLDLSSEGMKVAIEIGINLKVDQPCKMILGTGIDESYSLWGTVRWVEQSAYITVFGVLLESARLLTHGDAPQPE